MRIIASKYWFLNFAGATLLCLACASSLAAQQKPSENPTLHKGRTTEDWGSLSLKGSDLVPQVPVFGDKADLPGYTRELIRVEWRRADPIDLYIIRPKFVPKPRVILYLYSYPSEIDRFRNDDYCARLTSGGFAAVGFVSALTGQRYNMRPMKEWFVSELQESLGTSVHDVQMILNFLSKRDDLDANDVGMFATGSGGTIAILAAAVDPRIKAIDVVNPWGNWPDWMAGSSIIPENERPNYVKPEFLKKVEPLDPVRWLPQLKTAHVRIQEISDDTITPQKARIEIESAAPAGTKMQHYENVRQFFNASSAGRAFQWVKDQLHQGPETGPVASAPANGYPTNATQYDHE